jgi:hypothetical protein
VPLPTVAGLPEARLLAALLAPGCTLWPDARRSGAPPLSPSPSSAVMVSHGWGKLTSPAARSRFDGLVAVCEEAVGGAEAVVRGGEAFQDYLAGQLTRGAGVMGGDGVGTHAGFESQGGAPARRRRVSRAFPSWKRSLLTEIYLCHACSDHEIEDGNAWAG